MVARLQELIVLSAEAARQESDSPTVALPDNFQQETLQGSSQQRVLHCPNARPSQASPTVEPNIKPTTRNSSSGKFAVASSRTTVAAVTPKAVQASSANSQFHPVRVPIASVGDPMPTQRRLFDDIDASDVGPSLPSWAVLQQRLVFPELTATSYKAAIRPYLKEISRKKPFKAVAQLQGEAPILVYVQRIAEAKALSGLSNQEIADRAGIKSRHTVAKALRVDPSVGLYNFCEVMNVLGLEIAELFPMRKVRKPEPHRWPRGQYHSPENTRRKDYEMARADAARSGRKKRKRWG